MEKVAPQQFLEASLLQHKFLLQARYEAWIIKVFQTLRAVQIEPILIKGWSVARFYPLDKNRLCGDVDLCVHPKDYRSAVKTLENVKIAAVEIDLHKGVRHLDKLPFENLFAHSELVETAGTTIRVLRAEDNLRITAVHWLNDGGANQERLWDIFYLVQNRPADFDWERCLNAAGATRRRWIICAIALAHRYLDLNVADTLIAAEVTHPDVLPKWLVSALEKEWSDAVKLSDLKMSLKNWRAFKQQFRKRFPPNPLQASIEVEAPFNSAPRLPYQIANIGVRAYRSILRAVLN